jgi:hypothetical protein
LAFLVEADSGQWIVKTLAFPADQESLSTSIKTVFSSVFGIICVMKKEELVDKTEYWQ